jgi:hypothetical protein
MSLQPGETEAERVERMNTAVPLGRVFTVEEMAAAVLHLASDDATSAPPWWWTGFHGLILRRDSRTSRRQRRCLPAAVPAGSAEVVAGVGRLCAGQADHRNQACGLRQRRQGRAVPVAPTADAEWFYLDSACRTITRQRSPLIG